MLEHDRARPRFQIVAMNPAAQLAHENRMSEQIKRQTDSLVEAAHQDFRVQQALRVDLRAIEAVAVGRAATIGPVQHP